MLPKSQKLNGKEINYMLKRGKRVFGKYFIFWIIPQYSGNQYHQRAFQIPLKVEKRASMRNFLKRHCYALVKQDQTVKDSKYIKVFASINKKRVTDLKELIATHDKTAIVPVRTELVKKDLEILPK